MKVWKVLAYPLLFVLVVLVLLLGVLGSQTLLDTTAKIVLQKSGLPIRYDTLEGNLYGGLSVKGVSYGGKVKGNVALHVDFPALREGIVHIKRIHATDIWIDPSFLQALIENNKPQSKTQTSQGEMPIKKVIVDELELSAKNIAYQSYTLSSLQIRGSGLQYDMHDQLDGNIALSLSSNVADITGNVMMTKSHYDSNITVRAQQRYLNEILSKERLHFEDDPKTKLHLKGDLNQANFTIFVAPFGMRHAPYQITNKRFELSGLYHFGQKALQTEGMWEADSNVASMVSRFHTMLNTDDINHTLSYTLESSLEAFKPAFAKILKEQNLSFEHPGTIDIFATGNMQTVDANLSLAGGEIRYGPYRISPQNIHLQSRYNLTNQKLLAKGEGNLTANVADGHFRFDTFVRLDDIAHTLRIDLESDLVTHQAFLNRLLQEQNISVQRAPKLTIRAKTAEQKQIVADIRITQSAFERDGLQFSPKSHVQARYFPAKAWLECNTTTTLLSNAADIEIDANASMQLDDLDRHLRYHAIARAKAKESYLKSHLKEKKVDFSHLSPLLLVIDGDADAADARLQLRGEGRVERYRFATDIKETQLHYDLKSHRLAGTLNASIDSNIADMRTKTQFSLNLEDINHTLQYDAALDLRQKEAIADINLTQLGRVALRAMGSRTNVDATLTSPKLQATLQSSDLRRFDFSLDTKVLYLDRLYLALAPKFKKSSAAIEAKGYYDLQKKADIQMRLKSLHLAGRDIRTNRFRCKMDREDFSCTPLELRAKNFLLKMEVDRQNGQLQARIENRAFDGYIHFKDAPLFADAKLHIPDIDKMIREIDKIYPMEGVPKIRGALLLRAGMAGEKRVKISLTSPKIAFDAGALEKIEVIAYYRPNRVDIPVFSANMRGFKPKGMNKNIRLDHPAFIAWDAQNARIDFVLKALLSFKAEKKGDLLVGKLTTKRLFLAYPGYGQTRLSADIDLYQSGEQKALSGDISLAETEITYESRILDISQDPDIVIIEDKKRRLQTDDNFIKNTFLDLHIHSKEEVIYKVEAGTIALKPDIEVRKDFGSNVRLLGKIMILEGEYDWGDKRFKLKEGAIAFRGLEEINPHLDLHVEYEIDDVLIYIDILGDKRKPKLVFKSKPMMSKKDIFSYLLFGFAVSESDGAQSSAANAAEKIFGRALAKDLARELNLDRLDLTRNQLGGINIKAGKKMNKKTIIYYQNKEAQSSMIIERKFGRHLELDVEVGEVSQAVDIIYKKGFK